MLGTAAYSIIPEWLTDGTPGKFLFALRVTTTYGRRISLAQSLKRNVLRLIDFFPFYLPGFISACLTPNHQRLGDLWAKSMVVKNDRNAQAAISERGAGDRQID